jgi:hypothetical protein
MQWYVLIHQIPPTPRYLRAKVRQRLARAGAIPLKNSIYVLPRRDECLEDFQWLAQEIAAGGGQAFVCAMEFLETAEEEAVIERSRAERSAEYRELLRRGPKEAAAFRRRFEDIRAIDFFDAEQGKEAEVMLEKLEKPKKRGGRIDSLTGKTWVTRRGVKIDRIATAWLVRRFIDPAAEIRLIGELKEKREGEIAFDFVGGDYTHKGNRCTLETLLDATRLRQTALRRVAEVVHDIDLKEEKFNHPETAGVRALVEGLLQSTDADDERFTRGFELFDQLYESFRSRRR